MIFRDQDDWLIEADQTSRPGSELSGQSDMNGARNVRAAELSGRTRVEHDRPFLGAFGNYPRQQNRRRFQFRQWSGAGSIDLGILREVAGPLGQIIGEQMDELVARLCPKRKIGSALLADRRTAFVGKLLAAQRSGT